MSRRHLKPIICALAALIAWAVLPGTFLDRGLFSLTARAFAETPFFATGNGSHANPHTLRTLNTQAAPPADPLPDITITDDPDRVFQTSPPSPVDFAIILKNLRRLGRESIAIGMPLAWPEPDVISLMALDGQLDALPSVITCAPLSRGAIPSPIPPAFRRASLAVSEIHGNTRSIPLVNRVSIPDVLLGNTTSLAGFTALESEPDGGQPHLLARWDDRVVLSFPLLAALADLKISPAKIEIRMGEFISFGKDGLFIPIDEFGRLAFAPPPSDASASIPAESLIDAPEGFMADRREGTVLIRNGMLAADEASLRFSESLVTTASLLADPGGTSTSRVFPRIPLPAESLLLASLISLLHGLGNFAKTGDRRTLAILAGLVVILHFTLVPATGTWLPTLPALAAVLTAIPLTARRVPVSLKSEAPQTEDKPEPKPIVQPEFVLEPQSEPAPVPAAKKAARKAAKKVAQKAAKKTATKAARKAPAKKTPRKRKGR